MTDEAKTPDETVIPTATVERTPQPGFAGASNAPSIAAAAIALKTQADAATTDASSTAPRIRADGRPSGRARNSAVRVVRSPRVRRPARLVPAARVPGTAGQETDHAASDPPRSDTRSELRDWIKDNATLLSNASLLISISALALNLMPGAGFLDPYIQALIFGAAFVLLIELHHQWPRDLQMHVVGRSGLPRQHSWRMITFAVLFQIATVLFAIWATLTNPLILLPLTAYGVYIAFRTWYFRRFQGKLATIVGILILIAVLLISELLMVIVWALITNQEVTIELWRDRLPGFSLEIA